VPYRQDSKREGKLSQTEAMPERHEKITFPEKFEFADPGRTEVSRNPRLQKVGSRTDGSAAGIWDFPALRFLSGTYRYSVSRLIPTFKSPSQLAAITRITRPRVGVEDGFLPLAVLRKTAMTLSNRFDMLLATTNLIFDPLFTTKDSAGTGLGLWVCKQHIEKNPCGRDLAGGDGVHETGP
jgi:hypothetical protein